MHIILTKTANGTQTLRCSSTKRLYGHSVWKIFPHTLLNIKYIKAFQVFERTAVEQNQNSHYFALRHRKFTVPFLWLLIWRVILNQVIKFFEKFVNNEINFSNFIAGDHGGIISNVLLFSDLKILIFPLYS